MAVMQKMNMKMRSRSAGVRIAPASRRSMLKPARCAAPEGDKPGAPVPVRIRMYEVGTFDRPISDRSEVEGCGGSGGGVCRVVVVRSFWG